MEIRQLIPIVPMLRKVNSILELVGNTPLVRINRMNPAPGSRSWRNWSR